MGAVVVSVVLGVRRCGGSERNGRVGGSRGGEGGVGIDEYGFFLRVQRTPRSAPVAYVTCFRCSWGPSEGPRGECVGQGGGHVRNRGDPGDRRSTRRNSSPAKKGSAVFCLKQRGAQLPNLVHPRLQVRA